MRDFERKFQKSMVIMVSIHVLITFLTIFLIESHIPWQRGFLGQNFELRSAIDFLLRCSTPVSGTPDPSCLQKWGDTVEKVEQLTAELGIVDANIAAMRSIAYPDLLLDSAVKASALNVLREVAIRYDSDWAKKNKGFLTAVVSGGWMLGFLSIGFLILMNSFYKATWSSLIDPLLEITKTVSEWKGGNRLRRCQKKSEGRDVQMLMDGINELLDHRMLPKKDRHL